ncbi:MAG: phage terminase large subunit family protein, partial [Lentisphaeria bacterium]|nr:phage terminase large subunit family protein [Lentisphaeria bacterium]
QGFVLAQARLYRQFNRVGFRIAATENTRNINLIKYIAWLCDERHAPAEEFVSTARSYEERKEAERQRNAALSAAGRDIAPLPEVVNPERKKACERNFQLFCESYFPETYSLGWSPDHIKAIEKIETAVLTGGLFALAMPRGSGKSTLAETAAIWSMLYGHREFVTLIGATESAALEMLDSIKTELEVNENLAADFPEVCYPIEQLDGIANRCAGQHCNGERTRITWTSNEIVLPTIKDSKASGIIVRVAGITGRVRGMKYKRSDGRSVRPTLVIIDDPQTSESAGSLEQTRKRVRVLAGDILGLAGPGQKISGIMPCTIIRPGDMADIILNRNTHPDWNGEKTKMLYEFPKNMKLWDEYAEIRAEALRTDGNFQAATDFYLAHREEMDEGAVVSWDARYNHDEVSALQHAMNLKLQDEAAFQAEYQNDPLPEDLSDDTLLSVDEICGKVNGIARYRVPLACDRLTMFIDVQKALLFYTVVAWGEDFTGAIIDYGSWPDQHRRQFSLADANPTIQSTFPKAGFEGSLYAALTKLTDEYLGREWEREDGAVLKIERALVDANWGQSTDIVYQFCRQSTHAGIIMPSHGRYVGASSKPMTEYRKQPGDRLGFNWMVPNVAGKRAIRHVIYDTNFWKSFIHTRLAVELGDKGNLSLYGRIPGVHQLLAEHLTAEYKVKTQGRGRTVDEWKLKPDRTDNHWLDCIAGCAVCASMLGAALPETLPVKTARKPMIRLSDRRIGERPQNNVSGKMKLSDIRRSKNG